MTSPPVPARTSRSTTAGEAAAIAALFFVLAGSPPPDVNEAHYLAKAKHYWDPSWCAGDFFLESADAHLVFYWSFGWLTRWLSLPATAWVGRWITWTLLAWSWQRLSFAVVPRAGVSVLTAALFAVLLRWGHMAGEWVIGGVEAKGFAYVLVFLGLESLVRLRWGRAMLLSGAAAAFHVLVGGWGLIALGGTWLWTNAKDRPPVSRLILPALGALVLSLPGLVPALQLTAGVDVETRDAANQIYVFGRLSHHLVFHSLRHVYIFRHVLLMVVFVLLWKRVEKSQRFPAFSGPFPRFISGAIAIAVAGMAVDQSLLYFKPLAASLLRYYWFRMSDVMTPLGVALGLIAWQLQLNSHATTRGRAVLAGLILIPVIDVSSVVWQRSLDPRSGSAIQAFPGGEWTVAQRRERQRAWWAMTDWIEQHTPRAAIFLTPRHQQTFKWDASRAEVVNGKDVPQDAEGILGWRQRMREIFPWNVRYADLTAHGEPKLLEFAGKYRFRYIIVDRAVSSGSLSFRRIYPTSPEEDGPFEVYEIENP